MEYDKDESGQIYAVASDIVAALDIAAVAIFAIMGLAWWLA